MLKSDPATAVPVRAPVASFLMLLLPFSLLPAVWAARPIREAARRERSSLQTNGEIISSRVETMPCYGTCRGGPGHRARVVYRYAVDGRAYTSEGVTSLGDVGSLGWATEVAARYVPHQTAVVHYSAAAPGEAFLEPSPTRWYWMLGTVPFAVTCCLAGAMWAGNRAR